MVDKFLIVMCCKHETIKRLVIRQQHRYALYTHTYKYLSILRTTTWVLRDNLKRLHIPLARPLIHIHIEKWSQRQLHSQLQHKVSVNPNHHTSVQSNYSCLKLMYSSYIQV